MINFNLEHLVISDDRRRRITWVEHLRTFDISLSKEFVSKNWNNEKYKWEAVKWFQENWDIEDADFAEMLQAGIYTYALKLTQQLAADLGITEDDTFLTERMTAMQNGWRERYTQENGFHSAGSKYVDDRANALLVLSGLAGEEDYPQIIEVLANTYEASPFCEKYVLEALCLMSREDLAVQRILDRYTPMLTDEYDTLWEKFSEDRGTVNHGWTAAPLYILSKYIVGVQPTAPGYETYTVKPSEALDTYNCTVWTPRGNITVIKEGKNITTEGPSEGGVLILPEGDPIQIP